MEWVAGFERNQWQVWTGIRNLTEEDVIAHCRKSLTGYKVPKIIEFRTELPKTNVGKILRRELRG